MKKRLISTLLVCILFCASTLAEPDFSFLNNYTQEELTELLYEVAQKVDMTQLGDVIYEKDGISILWQGLIKDYSDLKTGLIIKNNTENQISFELDGLAMNGIEIGPSANRGSFDIDPGWAFYTVSRYKWLSYMDVCESLHLEQISQIGLRIVINGEATTVVFPVSFLLSDIPEE